MGTKLSVIQLMDFSVIVKWNPINSGQCYVLCIVEFLNGANQVVYRHIGNNATEITTSNSLNATNVKL